MRVHVPHVPPTVGIDDLLAIDLQLLVRVDGNQHNPYRKKANTDLLLHSPPHTHEQNSRCFKVLTAVILFVKPQNICYKNGKVVRNI